ncbi:transporter substrate-binding domain-containing protein [Streptomyces sp. NPDC093109]|uniref:transporter substrate-binding domain-containing protein n=1 Tax=Streptomyces sp. NPDC093109 TaxID=3154977 RepID=UPI003450E265
MRPSISRPTRRAGLLGIAVTLAAALTACGGGGGTSDSSASTASSASSGLNLLTPGTLTVGMNLQFPPEMYLDAKNEPAGYDVDLLNALATELGLKLKINNLDFNGLIPGLQSKQFDLVSVGLNATAERKKVVDFSRAYIPYTSVLAIKDSAKSPASADSLNRGGVVITALQGSSGEQLAKKTFPKATVTTFPDQNAALLEVATGRAQGSVLEDYILAQYKEANPGQVKKAELAKPLDINYGAWAVRKGNTGLVRKLDSFLCAEQTGDGLTSLYAKNFKVPAAEFPQMPAGC